MVKRSVRRARSLDSTGQIPYVGQLSDLCYIVQLMKCMITAVLIVVTVRSLEIIASTHAVSAESFTCC